MGTACTFLPLMPIIGLLAPFIILPIWERALPQPIDGGEEAAVGVGLMGIGFFVATTLGIVGSALLRCY